MLEQQNLRLEAGLFLRPDVCLAEPVGSDQSPLTGQRSQRHAHSRQNMGGPNATDAVDKAMREGTMDDAAGCLPERRWPQCYVVNDYVLDAIKWTLDSDDPERVSKFPELEQFPVPQIKDWDAHMHSIRKNAETFAVRS